jgi:hypothetical protein
MVDASAISLCQVTAQQTAYHGKSCAKDQEDDAGRHGTPEVWDEEDENPRIHQDRQHNSQNFPHALPPTRYVTSPSGTVSPA